MDSNKFLGHADKGPRNRFNFDDFLNSVRALTSIDMHFVATIFKRYSQNTSIKQTGVI